MILVYWWFANRASNVSTSLAHRHDLPSLRGHSPSPTSATLQVILRTSYSSPVTGDVAQSMATVAYVPFSYRLHGRHVLAGNSSAGETLPSSDVAIDVTTLDIWTRLSPIGDDDERHPVEAACEQLINSPLCPKINTCHFCINGGVNEGFGGVSVCYRNCSNLQSGT
jgi:hypothetical protein